MKTLSIYAILFLSSVSNILAQSPIYPEKLVTNFYFFEGKIKDTNQLELKIKFQNKGKSIAYTDTALINGSKNDFFGNVYFEFQILRNGHYLPYSDQSIDYKYGDSTPDVKRNYTLLKPGDTAILTYNLFHRTYSMSKGKYKMRVHLLKAPINNPPKEPMSYITSKWFYYEVLRDLYKEQKITE